ncbi:glutamate--cysteine ligase [Motiliproteus sediminis]|uniref:glutamate--cysteine ligase n=1 Tax=Motiliproteus sediminis TaxID=1468178 RepID=UPI001AEFA14E|nr:glutamate--cysteine ligase [Motiliproteus sediminis]
MSQQLQRSLQHLADSGQIDLLASIRHGVEKEGLRVSPEGRISSQPHPQALGSALTHPRITTDYSEALLEFITPVYRDIDAMLNYLDDLHRYTYQHLGSETIWGGSMPCRIDDPAEVTIADYGRSHIGRLKHIYRVGLEYRYGRVMQSIAGIHYNFSAPEELWPLLKQMDGSPLSNQAYRSARYFGLIRNFRRHSWLLIYLFGASPALDRRFVADRPHGLEQFDDDTLYGPYATSLRMSDLGYSNRAQSTLNVCYNTLDNYVHTLSDAIARPYPQYQQIGVKVDGHYRQLNTNLLQIENEYYSDIRPKRVAASGERPLQAIRARGVEYVEVRNVDINPFIAGGIDAAQARFTDCFLLHCLLTDAPYIEGEECDQVKDNLLRVVRRGREPGLTLMRGAGTEPMQQWAHRLLEEMVPVAEALDAAHGGGAYRDALTVQRAKVDDSALTPSARLLAYMREHGQSYNQAMLDLSRQHRERLEGAALGDEVAAELTQMAAESLAEQRALEQESEGDFDQFLAAYISR